MEIEGSEPPADGQLWARAVGGDADAFAVLFRRHARAVYNHAFRTTASSSLAEDLAAAVFLEAWRRRHDVTVADDGSLLPWLLGVATNLSRNATRSVRRSRRLLERLPRPEAVADHAEETAQRVDAERQMRQVQAAIGGLSAPERDVLQLCVWAGLSYQETAEALHVPVGTVRSRLSRARQHLRSTCSDAITGRPAAGYEGSTL